ncbi:hypothetical protein GR925_25790 [Streptomyces sp. HUCO-GS316]|uniref:hypothetical protein n=1 Tax=Streptomyces sp. HUCO-GS316 TaxID=2692198 RepID=UPI001370B0A2|nr:hypothetical protein [Streptomyces sp. HUCO-GS316]MXM66749.1 hypothetical protein [Streptomyces sp. HUCO-GS316]
MNGRTLALASAAAILAGALVAYCDHRGDDPGGSSVDCASAPLLAPAATKTKSKEPRESREWRAPVSKEPAARPSASSSPRRAPHVDLDLEIGGC